MRRALLVLALGLLFPSAAQAALQPPALTLDAAFAPPSGLLSDNLTDSSSDQASDVAYFNGRTYTVGSATIGGDTGVAITARRANGTLDTGFSDDGKLVLQIAPATEADKAGGIVVLPDGRLRLAVDADVMVGSDSNHDIVLLGLNPDGSYDQTFGGGTGIVQITIGPKDDVPSRLAVDAQGRIAVTGYTTDSNNLKDTFVSLRNPDGSPVASFGTGGVRVIQRSPAGVDDRGVDVAFRPAGGLYLLMSVDTQASVNGDAGTFAVLRALAEDGSDDPGFGSGGETEIVGGDRPTVPSRMLVHNGRVWVTGLTHTGADQDAFLARVESDGSGLTARRFDMRDASASATDIVSSAGTDVIALDGPPETLVVVGNSGSGSTAQYAAAAFNGFDGDLATAGFGQLVVSGSNQFGFVGAAPSGPDSLVVAGLYIDFNNNFKGNFVTARLLLDADKKCDLAVDVPTPLELTFVGRKGTLANVSVTNKGTKPCSGVVSVAAPYALGRSVVTPVITPGDTWIANAVPVTAAVIRRDDDVVKFSVFAPNDADPSNDIRGVRAVFSFCDLALSAVEKPSTVPSEGTRRVEVGLKNVGTTTCRRVQMKVVGGSGGGASAPYSIDRGLSVSDNVNLGVKSGVKVGKKVTLQVRSSSFDDDVVPANDTIKLSARVVGVGDTRVGRTGAASVSGTATGGKAPTKADRKGVQLTKVEVAIRRLGSGCRWLSGKKAHFTNRKTSSCTPSGWQAASGTRSWRLSMRALPAGRYQVYTRAVTRNGFREARFAASDRNRVTFRVS